VTLQNRTVSVGPASSGTPKTRTFGAQLIDCEKDRTLRAVLVGMLREAARAQ
jgi:hypothetical protein